MESPRQSANVSGTGHVVVQVSGEHNHVRVTSGTPTLVLTKFSALRKIQRPLDHLSPYAQATPLRGREHDLASLRAFLVHARPVGVRVVVGPGGSGKTRLALEACDEAAALGWDSGFVTGNELRRFFALTNLSAWDWERPTLIVVDDAAQHSHILAKWLEELTDRTHPASPPLRLLLLERSADTEAGWWPAVFSTGGWGASAKVASLDPAEPVEIQPIEGDDERRAIVTDMLNLLAAQAAPGTQARRPPAGAVFAASNSRGDPLFLQMAALEMARVGHRGARVLDRLELAQGLAGQEADRLRRFAESHGLSPELMQHLAACVTLTHGMSDLDVERLAGSEQEAAERSGRNAAALSDLMMQALPRPDGVAPIQPDLIGEAFVLKALKRERGRRSVLRCFAQFGPRVAECIIRCAQDFTAQAAVALQWLEDIAAAHWDCASTLASLSQSLPRDTVVLARFRLLVVERLHVLKAGDPQCTPDERAEASHELAFALAEAGRLEDALKAAEDAVERRRLLMADDQQEPKTALASSLHSLAIRLCALKRFDLVLTVTEEAVLLRRELAAANPDLHRLPLASSLNNLAGSLSEAGHHERALQAAQEAVGIFSDLASSNPDEYRQYVALSLNTLGSMLAELGQENSAHVASRESVDLYRELVAVRPDRFRPYLASALHNLSIRQNQPGFRHAALDTAREAVALNRLLVDQHPDVHLPKLANSLTLLAQLLRHMSLHEEALQAADDAVRLWRRLADQRPELHGHRLAVGLAVLAEFTGRIHGPARAIPLAEEAVRCLDALRATAAASETFPARFVRRIHRELCDRAAPALQDQAPR